MNCIKFALVRSRLMCVFNIQHHLRLWPEVSHAESFQWVYNSFSHILQRRKFNLHTFTYVFWFDFSSEMPISYYSWCTVYTGHWTVAKCIYFYFECIWIADKEERERKEMKQMPCIVPRYWLMNIISILLFFACKSWCIFLDVHIYIYVAYQGAPDPTKQHTQHTAHVSHLLRQNNKTWNIKQFIF